MIEWIVTSSILIAVIITLRYLLKGKISLRIQYALWVLVLVRLLVPLSLGNAGFSVLNILPENPAEAVLSAALSVGVPSDAYTLAAGATATPENNAVAEAQNETPHYNEDAVTKVETHVTDWGAIAFAVWITGIVVVGSFLLVSNLRFAARVKKTRRAMNAGEHRLSVYVTNAVDTPCLFGLFHPAIYITPETEENAAILRHTIEHETTHFNHGDNFWAILRGICLALHWYNPLVWWAAFLSMRDSELACDEATINRIGEAERAEYGRTLIGMTCQKRTALLITATTMTGSKSSIKERIMLIAKKPKMAIYTLIAVVLIAAVAVGCTFTGAKEGQENFSPDTVSMAQMLSSAFHPDPITDAETVEYLWSLYQGFEFDGTAETLDKENVWSISVAFSNSESGESESFTIFQGGLCQLGDDYETYHILLDGAEIYNEILSYFEAAKKTQPVSQSGVNISADDLGDVPDAVIDYAKDCVAQQIDAYHSAWPEIAPGCSVTEAKITGLTQMNTGTAGLNTSVNLYLLEYRLLVSGNIDSVLVGEMSYKEINGENWLTEWSSVGQPYLLLYCDDSGAEPAWDRICVTNSEEIYQYNTSEMLAQYGDYYTAAAMELYNDYMNSDIENLIIDALNSDGAYAEAAQDALVDSLMADPSKTLEAIGARAEGIQNWLCWTVASGIKGRALDATTILPTEGLSENGQYARALISQYLSANSDAPENWRQIYLHFWDETAPEIAKTGEIVAIGLFDLHTDGVPQLAVWLEGSSDGTLYYTDGVSTYHNLGNIYEGDPPDDSRSVLSVQNGDTLSHETVNAFLNSWRPHE